ncbi:MAG: NUDIX domain-containing protein [bacterium]|nr:NUDIX domain-containing protein [bacterium]
MPKEQSAGAVVFRLEDGQPKYLLLYYPSMSKKNSRSYWDLPKGHVEPGEKEEDTVHREVQEETGLRGIKLLPGFRELINYSFRAQEKNIFKTVVFYLAQTDQQDVRISFEHAGCVWLPYTQAMSYLKFQNAKRVITKAHHFLSKEGLRSRQNHPQGTGAHVSRGGATHRPTHGVTRRW